MAEYRAYAVGIDGHFIVWISTEAGPLLESRQALDSCEKVRSGWVRVDAYRAPCWSRAFSVRSATYAEISRSPTSVLIHTRWACHSDSGPLAPTKRSSAGSMKKAIATLDRYLSELDIKRRRLTVLS
jgi:hypothetical protein